MEEAHSQHTKLDGSEKNDPLLMSPAGSEPTARQ